MGHHGNRQNIYKSMSGEAGRSFASGAGEFLFRISISIYTSIYLTLKTNCYLLCKKINLM